MFSYRCVVCWKSTNLRRSSWDSQQWESRDCIPPTSAISSTSSAWSLRMATTQIRRIPQSHTQPPITARRQLICIHRALSSWQQRQLSSCWLVGCFHSSRVLYLESGAHVFAFEYRSKVTNLNQIFSVISFLKLFNCSFIVGYSRFHIKFNFVSILCWTVYRRSVI